MEEITTVKKILLNGNFYFLKVTWSEVLKFSLFHRDQFWSGVLTLDKIEYFSSHLKISKEKYIENAKSALSSDDSNSGFIFNFSNNKFTWEKCINESASVRYKHGIVEMQNSSEGGNEVLTDELLKLLKEKECKLRDKDQELVAVAEQLNELIEKFQHSTDLKIKMEQDLYSKFVTLLNEKKQKIAEYEDFIKHLETKGLVGKSNIPALKDKQDMRISDSD